jgi:hypothetical protein
VRLEQRDDVVVGQRLCDPALAPDDALGAPQRVEDDRGRIDRRLSG